MIHKCVRLYNLSGIRYVDCTDVNQQLKIQEVYKECCDYSDALVDLFEE